MIVKKVHVILEKELIKTLNSTDLAIKALNEYQCHDFTPRNLLRPLDQNILSVLGGLHTKKVFKNIEIHFTTGSFYIKAL